MSILTFLKLYMFLDLHKSLVIKNKKYSQGNQNQRETTLTTSCPNDDSQSTMSDVSAALLL